MVISMCACFAPPARRRFHRALVQRCNVVNSVLLYSIKTVHGSSNRPGNTPTHLGGIVSNTNPTQSPELVPSYSPEPRLPLYPTLQSFLPTRPRWAPPVHPPTRAASAPSRPAARAARGRAARPAARLVRVGVGVG
eukprot:scaffold85590_cov62-Phaeocystis_antarctica.AAC.3